MTWRALAAAFSAALMLSSAIHAQLADERSRREALLSYRTGADFLSSGRFEQAAEQFRKAIQKDHLLVEAHYELGQAYMGLRQYPGAIKAYQDAIVASRALHDLELQNRATIESAIDDRMWEIDKEIAVFNRLADPHARELMNRRRQLELIKRSQTGIAESFEPPSESLFALGSAYFRNGQLIEAEAQWKAALEVDASMGKAHNNLAVLYMLTGRIDEAEEEVRLAEKNGTQVNPQLKSDMKRVRGR
jgi:Tfp pilus assembly protein PilF